MNQHLHEQLQALPDDWPFVAVDGNKRAYQKAWQAKPLTNFAFFLSASAQLVVEV